MTRQASGSRGVVKRLSVLDRFLTLPSTRTLR